ncbi:hypothetical protein FGO68_gene14534 [Halteria grandinella]|uniref:Small ribosomal subunit protein uS7 domain-containing protein n=1 Tax=Halteria grandinella TaxID=5974 RepID=A0A8J8NLZ1_HALGN|nr:hypothetical protein FGO68_gene14534 [Halteria grandinella]
MEMRELKRNIYFKGGGHHQTGRKEDIQERFDCREKMATEQEDIKGDDQKITYATEVKLFGRWSYEGVQSKDISLMAYLNVKTIKAQVFHPFTAGRYQRRSFQKVNCPIVERLLNSLMMKGRNNGKKQMAIRIVKQALELVALQTGENPLQILIDAISNGGAREDSTRIGSGGVVRRQAVDKKDEIERVAKGNR